MARSHLPALSVPVAPSISTDVASPTVSPAAQGVLRSDSPSPSWWSITLLQGVVVTEPVTRNTARGPITELDIRTRAFVSSDQRDAGPPTAVGVVSSPALVGSISLGDEVLVIGTTKRRFFRTGGTTVARTEIEAVSVVKAIDRRKRTKTLDGALAWINEVASRRL